MFRRIKKLEPYLYILPALVFFGTFSFYPFLKTLGLSFFTVNANGQVRSFAGVANYVRVFQDPNFIRSIGNTAIYVALASPVSIIIALILALLANKKTRTSSIYETMFALTMAMSVSVAALVFKIMYNPYIGIINKILRVNINWLNDSSTAMVAISFISVWMNIGFNYLFLVAAIRNVPESILESADLDGMNIWQKVRYMILPMISPTIFFLVINSLGRNIIMSGLPLILTDGGPHGSTSTMIFYMYKQAFSSYNYNNAYATAIVTFVFSLIAILIGFAYEKKGVHYQ